MHVRMQWCFGHSSFPVCRHVRPFATDETVSSDGPSERHDRLRDNSASVTEQDLDHYVLSCISGLPTHTPRAHAKTSTARTCRWPSRRNGLATGLTSLSGGNAIWSTIRRGYNERLLRYCWWRSCLLSSALMHTRAMPLAYSLMHMVFGVHGPLSPRLRSSGFFRCSGWHNHTFVCSAGQRRRRDGASARQSMLTAIIRVHTHRSCSGRRCLELVYGMQRFAQVYLFYVFIGERNGAEECPPVGGDSVTFVLPKWRMYARCVFWTRLARG